MNLGCRSCVGTTTVQHEFCISSSKSGSYMPKVITWLLEKQQLYYCARSAAATSCIYIHHIEQSMDQPGKVANPARGELNREK